MIASIVVLSVGLILITIFWDVRRRQRQIKTLTVAAPRNDGRNRLFAIFVAVFCAVLGIWWVIAPPEPPFGAKGLLLHLAYLLIGKYGPSLMAFFLGAVCLVFSRKSPSGDKKTSE